MGMGMGTRIEEAASDFRVQIPIPILCSLFLVFEKAKGLSISREAFQTFRPQTHARVA
jgi:hypothetical protein